MRVLWSHLTLLVALAGVLTTPALGVLDSPPSFAAPDGRFLPTATVAADYRALREVVQVVLLPAHRNTLETRGQPMCAIERSGRIVCAGAQDLEHRRLDAPPAPAFATPCFGAPGVFDGPVGDPLVAVDLDNGLCAIGASGRVYCSSLASPPLLGWADRDDSVRSTSRAPKAIALTQFAALYDDKTLRLRGARPDRFGPPRPLLGVAGQPTAMTQGYEGELCLLTDSGQAYCTDDQGLGDLAGAETSAPIRFLRVGAPSVASDLGGSTRCTEASPCEPLEDVIELAETALFHSCALTRQGEVVCWGSPTDRPFRVPGFSAPVSLALGRSGVCVVTRAGSVECVGVNWFTEAVSEPVSTVPDLVDVARLAMKGDGLCAVTRAGRVDCRMVPPPPPPRPAATGDDEDSDDVPPEWYAEETEPAVAILGWTRDLEDLVFAGTWSEFDEALTPLIGVTTTGGLLGTKAPPVVNELGSTGPEPSNDPVGRFAFAPGLPCLSAGGQTFCRSVDAKRWGPWRPVPAPTRGGSTVSSARSASPWWLAIPNTAADIADLDGVAEVLAAQGLSALEMVGWDGVPCLRLDDGTVRCVRRMGTRIELVPVPAPRKDRYDVCSAFVDGPGEHRLEGVIDIDGSHDMACALLDNRSIVCWGQLGHLPSLAHEARRLERRWAPRVIARLHGAVELAVTSDFVCARMAVNGEVRCVGSAGLGLAPGRWGGFGAWPTPVVGLSGITRLAALPGHPIVCAWSRPPPDRPATTQRPRTERKDPRLDPHGALADALAEGRAVCWGDEDALRYLNATWLGSPIPLKRL